MIPAVRQTDRKILKYKLIGRLLATFFSRFSK